MYVHFLEAGSVVILSGPHGNTEDQDELHGVEA